MQKDGSIIIHSPQKGVGTSALIGNETIVGCEIFEEPGVLKMQNSLTADASQTNNPAYVTITGMPVADVTNYNSVPVVQRTVLTEGGQLMSIANADFLLASLSRGWDACVWSTLYTVVSYTSGGTGSIGVIYHDPSSNGASWFGARIGSLTGTGYIKLLMGQDNYMYYTNGNTIGRITDITGGATPSCTFSSNVLDLPNGVMAVALAELGTNLMIGTHYGYSYDSRQSFIGADIYPWDRVSSSFRLPVKINENGINSMVAHNNQVYFSAGVDGQIYVTDGLNYRAIKTLPFSKIKKLGVTCSVYPNAMCINQQGNLLVGTSSAVDTTPNSTTIHGVWEIGLTTGYPSHLPFISRDLNVGKTSTLKIGSVRMLDYLRISIGVSSNSTYELSTTDYTLTTGYLSTWETEVFQVGTRKNRRSFRDIEFLFSKPLVANQGIKISYRKNLTDTYTLINTWDFSTIGGVISHLDKALIVDAELLQFKIQITQSSGIFGNNVNLLKVILT